MSLGVDRHMRVPQTTAFSRKWHAASLKSYLEEKKINMKLLTSVFQIVSNTKMC